MVDTPQCRGCLSSALQLPRPNALREGGHGLRGPCEASQGLAPPPPGPGLLRGSKWERRSVSWLLRRLSSRPAGPQPISQQVTQSGPRKEPGWASALETLASGRRAGLCPSSPPQGWQDTDAGGQSIGGTKQFTTTMLRVDKGPLSTGGLRTTQPGCLCPTLADRTRNILPETAWRGEAPESEAPEDNPQA